MHHSSVRNRQSRRIFARALAWVVAKGGDEVGRLPVRASYVKVVSRESCSWAPIFLSTRHAQLGGLASLAFLAIQPTVCLSNVVGWPFV